MAARPVKSADGPMLPFAPGPTVCMPGLPLSEPIRARRVPHADLELINDKVTLEGGELRILSGSDYGLVTSMLRQTAIHQNPRAQSEFEDGTRRD